MSEILSQLLRMLETWFCQGLSPQKGLDPELLHKTIYTQEAASPKCSTPMPKVVVGGPQVTGLEGVFLGFYT